MYTMYSFCTCMKIILLGSHIDITAFKKKKLLFSFKGPPKIVQKYILNSSPTIYHDIIYLGITGIVPRLNYPLQNRSTN